MTPKEFKAKYWADIVAVCQQTGLNPLFVASQAALESGWGKAAIGNNLFGITAGDKWLGARQMVRTTEYFSDDRQGGRFAKVHKITLMADGRFKYEVDRAFRDYDSVSDSLRDHFAVLSMKRYIPAMAHKQSVYDFAYWVAQCGYCTAPAADYARSILSISKTIDRL